LKFARSTALTPPANCFVTFSMRIMLSAMIC
jgi:hypothetical protein